MEIQELNKVLKQRAISLNACNKGLSFMDKLLDQDELITLWKNFFDFAIDNDFPTNEFIKENFDVDTLHKNLVYLDEVINAYNNNGTVVVNGECSGILMYDSFGCATIYVRHNSNVIISAKGFSKIFIHCYDDSKVHIIQSEMANVYCYMHGNSAETHEGEVNFRQKR